MSDRWLHRGKEARANGKSRELKDGRVSLTNRAQFFDGWDEQNRMMAPAATEEQRAEADRVRARLKEWAKTL